MINVVNKYSHKPSPNDFYIGRGSPLGNPFTSIQDRKTKANFVCSSREESISKFKSYLEEKIENKYLPITSELNRIYSHYLNSKEVNLICFCSPKKCHGDVIKSILEKVIK